MTFEKELVALINKYGYDQEVNANDYIIAEYIIKSIKALSEFTNSLKETQ